MNGRIKRGVPERHPSLPIIGKIKIGKKSDKGFPMAVDYFIPDSKYASLFHDTYGEKPNTIQIFFPSSNPDDVCRERYEYRTNKGELYAFGDGEEFFVWNREKYVRMTTEDYPDIMNLIQQKFPSKQGWRVRLTLTFLLPKVFGVLGLWRFETSGDLSSIPNIRNTFDMMSDKGVMFNLSVSFAKSQKPDGAARFPVVSIVPIANTDECFDIKQIGQ